MKTINTGIKSKAKWEEDLNPSEYEALKEMFSSVKDNVNLTPNEVLDAIVEYEGGIASGYTIRSIISRVYGIELE